MGESTEVARVEGIFTDFEYLRKIGIHPHNGELNALLKMVVSDPTVTLRGLVESGKQRNAGVKRMVQPRSPNQRKYVEAIENHDMTFGIGPAGTGKTYLAVAMAVSALLAKKVSRIILVRPAVEAGERLGFLPGSLQEKVDPYMRPLYDALYDLLDPIKVDKMLETNVIEIAPLAFMRGAEHDQRADEDVPDAPGQRREGDHHGRSDADGPAQSEEERIARSSARSGRRGGDQVLPL
jgi:phosphate starvation-inducible PhoH-like protein